MKAVVIVGPTATGKSNLAVRIAKKINGEIISADSRQVYKGLDIGSGKITKKEMGGVKHYLLDVISPKKIYSAANFLSDAESAIKKIVSNNKIPIIVGGTGFYIDILLGRESISETPPNMNLRKRLLNKSSAELYTILSASDPKRAKAMNNSDKNNPRRLIRAIEIARSNKKTNIRAQIPIEPIYLGLKTDLNDLKKRIHLRLVKRIRSGMINEAKKIHKSGVTLKRMEDLGLEYRYLAKLLKEEITKNELIETLDREILKYAKRQITWFKRNKTINWFNIKESRQAIMLAGQFAKS
jgi:tRNA dimethylallyltransferase